MLFNASLQQGITNTLSLQHSFFLSLCLSLFLAIIAADVVCRSLSSPSVQACWRGEEGVSGAVVRHAPHLACRPHHQRVPIACSL